MSSNIYAALSETEFDRRLTPERLRTMQIIQGALMASMASILFINAVLFTTTPASDAADAETVSTLSLIVTLLSLSCILASVIVPKRLVDASRRTASPDDDLYAKAVTVMQTSMLLRMAILEGAGMFGLAVCIIAVTGGLAQTEPVWLLNALPAVIMLSAGALTFPTRTSLALRFVREFRES